MIVVCVFLMFLFINASLCKISQQKYQLLRSIINQSSSAVACTCCRLGKAIINTLLLIPHASTAIIFFKMFFFFVLNHESNNFICHFTPRVVSLFCQIKFHGEGLQLARLVMAHNSSSNCNSSVIFPGTDAGVSKSYTHPPSTQPNPTMITHVHTHTHLPPWSLYHGCLKCLSVESNKCSLTPPV